MEHSLGERHNVVVGRHRENVAATVLTRGLPIAECLARTVGEGGVGGVERVVERLVPGTDQQQIVGTNEGQARTRHTRRTIN